MSSNQKRRSKADGMKVRFPTVATRGFLFSALSASYQEEKYIRSGSRRKICQQRIKESLWDQGSNQSTTFTLLVVFLSKSERNETQLYQTILSSKLVLYRVQIDKRANNLYMATIDPDLDGQYFGL